VTLANTAITRSAWFLDALVETAAGDDPPNVCAVRLLRVHFYGRLWRPVFRVILGDCVQLAPLCVAGHRPSAFKHRYPLWGLGLVEP
ncbi:MAG TPA: hypothetical protein VGW38_10100, partial [Chloroflexota bacterium]|nr:hypothetical protein [Chloroflexota bacterium]